MIGHFLFPLSSKMLYINYVLCWRYIIHVLSILCWHVFCFPKKTCFIYIKNTSLIQKHRSITLTWGCLCGKGMPFWRIKGVSFMRCISTHKRIWSRLCGRRVMRRHNAVLAGDPVLSGTETHPHDNSTTCLLLRKDKFVDGLKQVRFNIYNDH